MSRFESDLSLNPDLDEAYGGKGIALAFMGLYDQAVQEFDQAIRISPGYTSYYMDRGQIFVRMQLYEKAYADFGEAIRTFPQYVPAYLNRAIVASVLGFDDQSESDLIVAEELGASKVSLNDVRKRIGDIKMSKVASVDEEIQFY